MHRLNMHCIKVATKNIWGPFPIEDEFTVPVLTRGQLKYFYEELKVIPVISRHRKLGIWAGSACTRECRHAFFGLDEASPVRSTYPGCSTRSVCSTRYIPSDEV